MQLKNKSKTTGNLLWGEFGLRFLGVFIAYAAAQHYFAPFDELSWLSPTRDSAVKIIGMYLLYYFIMYLSICFVIFSPVLILAKIIPTYRRIPLSHHVCKSLTLVLLLSAMLVYGQWYGAAH